jgi:hypothetical protein
MQWLYRGFEQTKAGREYRFQTLGFRKEELKATFVIDLTLMRNHGIHLQDGPTLCLRKLGLASESISPADPVSDLRIAVSDQDMITFVNQQELLRERRGRSGVYATTC